MTYRTIKFVVAAFLGIVLFPFSMVAQQDSTAKKVVYVFSIEEEIAPPATLKTEKALDEAKKLKSDYIIVKINTFGGTLDDAEKIRVLLSESPIPVLAYIEHNAASAGALIALACDSIYMHSASSMGAATVVNQSGEVQPDKYQSYMRSKMRAMAEAHGRNPDMAQAMVDPSIQIEGVVELGKILTFTTKEAIKHGYCEGQANNIQEVLQKANIPNAEIKEQHLTAIHHIIRFLMHPIVSGLLILIIIGGIYFELQTPGIGFPLIAGIMAAVLFFAPLYLEGLASHWEILLFVVGLVLIALEIFVIPGFGVAGISGIVLTVVGLTLSLIQNNGFDFSAVSTADLLNKLSMVIISLVMGVGLCIFLSERILTKNTFGHLALNTTQNASEGYTVAVEKEKSMIGKKGIALTMLRPSGKIEIENDMYDALAFNSYIEKGEAVEVIDYQNASLIVKKYNS